MQSKIIKRYRNRKLYDAERSAYITLDDVRVILREGKDVKIIDQKTQGDITGPILLQLLHETERKARLVPSAELLKEIIRRGDGSFSGFLRALGGYESRLEERTPSIGQGLRNGIGSERNLQAAVG